MSTKYKLLFAFLSFFQPCLAQNQAITVKETVDHKDDYLHEFFHPVEGRYLAINYATPHGAFNYNRNTNKTHIVGYDAKLNEVYKTYVKELAGNTYHGAIEMDNSLHAIYADGKKIFRCEIDPATGEGKNKPAQLLSIKYEAENFYKGYSTDSAYSFVIINYNVDHNKSWQYEGVVMDKKMNVVTTFVVKLEKLKDYIENRSFVLSNEGLLFMIHAIRVKSKEFKPLQYLISEISKDGKEATSFLENMPAGKINNLVWKPAKTGLSFVGLLAKNEKEGFKHIISGNFNSWQKKVADIKEVNFVEAPWWQSVNDKFTKLASVNGVHQNVTKLNSFVNTDGSVVMIMQWTNIIYTSRGNFSYTDSHAGSIYAIKIKADGEFDWLQVIPVSQREATYPIYSGCIAAQTNNKDVVVVFYDNEKNNKRAPSEDLSGIGLTGNFGGSHQLTAVTIKEDGAMSRSAIGKNMDPDHHLASRNPFSIYGNEILYTSFNHRNVGKSTYKLGTIKFSK